MSEATSVPGFEIVALTGAERSASIMPLIPLAECCADCLTHLWPNIGLIFGLLLLLKKIVLFVIVS